jgi:hypothetical protein
VEAEKEMMKEKARKVSEEVNIRDRLRPHDDGKMIDKAKDLTSKKNLEKQGNFCTFVNLASSALYDVALTMKVDLGDSIEKRMQTIDIIQQLENARYSIYAKTIKNARDLDKLEAEKNQDPMDLSAFRPLLCDDDEGIGELDDQENSLDNFESPLPEILNTKSFEPASVMKRVKIKFKKRGK